MKRLKVNGFTLVEMLVVLLIISVLLLLIIPNVVNQTKTINSKGCQALLTMVEGQVQNYKLEKNVTPTLQDLVRGGYIKNEQKTCPNGSHIAIDSEGRVYEGSST